MIRFGLIVLLTAGLLSSPVARADSIERIIDWLARHFQVRPPITTGAFRGGGSEGGLWIVAADGGASRQLSPEHRYLAAVFSGSEIFAIRDGRIVKINPITGTEHGVACSVGTKDPPFSIFSGGEPGHLGVVTQAGRILDLTFSNRCSPKVIRRLPKNSAVSNPVRKALDELARHCGDRQVASIPQEDASGLREDIFVLAPGQANRALTSESATRVHQSPSFSVDCRQIIYLAQR